MAVVHPMAIATLLAFSVSIAATADEQGQGELPLKNLVERLGSKDNEIRKAAADALQMRTAAVHRAMGGLTGSSDVEDLAAADRFQIEGKPLVLALVKLLRSPDEESRVGAALVLGAIGPEAEKCRPALREVIRDTTNSRGLRMAAVPALLSVMPPDEVAGREFVESFRNAFSDGADGDGDLGGLDAKWTDESIADWSGPFLAALLISSGRTTIEVPSLVEAMQMESPKGVRLTALATLATLEVEARGALPSLRKLLSDRDRSVRRYAGLAIVCINADSADLPSIIKAMSLSEPERSKFQDEASTFLEQKAEASKQIRDGRADLVADVVPMLKHRNSYHQRQAIRMLGEIGAPAKDAIPELKSLLKSDDKDTREAAAEALHAIEGDGAPAANGRGQRKAD